MSNFKEDFNARAFVFQSLNEMAINNDMET